jgi:hypothetical protein
MTDHHGEVFRDQVQVVNVEEAAVFDFGVVEELALNPGARRCLLGFGA